MGKSAFLIDFMPKDPLAREEAESALQSISGLIAITFVLFFVVNIMQHGAKPGFWQAMGYAGLPATVFATLSYVNARARFAYLSASTTLAISIVIFQAGTTYLLHAYGSTSTPITSIYIIVVVVFTVFFSGQAGALATVACILFYNALVAVEQVGVLEYAPYRPFKEAVGKNPTHASIAATAVTSIVVSAYAISLYVYSILSRRRDALRDANEELSVLNEAKSRFLGIVSHDLRTPITSIKAFGELIEEEVSGEIKSFAGTIVNESDRLHRLVTDLLDLDKMEAGQMEWNRLRQDIRPVLDNAVRVFGGAAQDKDITLDSEIADTLPPVDIDADRIAQLVANLLSNAIKFTPAGGRVTVSACGRNDVLDVTVADTGPGIPPDDLDRIFDRFSQTDTAKGAGAGTGLGLVIAREVATGHGGDLRVASTVGEGTRFTLILPMSASPSR